MKLFFSWVKLKILQLRDFSQNKLSWTPFFLKVEKPDGRRRPLPCFSVKLNKRDCLFWDWSWTNETLSQRETLTAGDIHYAFADRCQEARLLSALTEMSNFVVQPQKMNSANWIFRIDKTQTLISKSWCSVGTVKGYKQGTWGSYLSTTQIFSLSNYKKNISPYFNFWPQVSEVYPVQQYLIVCLLDEHRSCFLVKPRSQPPIVPEPRQAGLFHGEKLTLLQKGCEC